MHYLTDLLLVKIELLVKILCIFLVYCFFLYYVCFYLRVNNDEYIVWIAPGFGPQNWLSWQRPLRDQKTTLRCLSALQLS